MTTKRLLSLLSEILFLVALICIVPSSTNHWLTWFYGVFFGLNLFLTFIINYDLIHKKPKKSVDSENQEVE